MKIRYPMFANSILFGWLTATIVLFMLTNRISYVQLFFPEQISANSQIKFLSGEILNFFKETAKAITGGIFFSSAALFFGSIIFRWNKFSLARIVTSIVIGQILYSVMLLTMISAGRLEKWTTATILLSGAISGMLWMGVWVRRYRTLILGYCTLTFASLKRYSLLIHPIIIFGTGILYSTSRLSYDSVAYYFSHAKILAITGDLILLYPQNSFAVSDLHSSILFSSIIQLFGDQAARLLSWVNGAIIALSGWVIGSKIGLSTRAQAFFLITLLTSTAFVDLLGDGKLELISTAPIAAALGWMVDSLKHPSRKRFLLIGTLLGFAIISRPYNFFLVPIFTILFYLFQAFPVLRTSGLRAAWHFARPSLWILPAVFCLVMFHLWQNTLWLGSPLAPFTHAQNLHLDDWHWQSNPASLNMFRLLYPLTVTFLNTPQSLGNISPLFIGVLPFLLLKNVRARMIPSARLRSLLLPALVTLALWITLFFTVVEIRYIFFLWILLLLFGAQVIEAAFDTLEKGYRAILRAALALLLGFIVIRTLLISFATYSPINANEQAHCYNIAFCTFLDPLNESAPEGTRVFVLNAYRYYLRPDLFACSSQAQEYTPLQTLAKENSGQFWVELYRQGFRYVTYEKNFAEFHSRFGSIPSQESAPKWLTVKVISSTQNEKIYGLQPTNPPFFPLKTCMKTDTGLWQVIAKSIHPLHHP